MTADPYAELAAAIDKARVEILGDEGRMLGPWVILLGEAALDGTDIKHSVAVIAPPSQAFYVTSGLLWEAQTEDVDR